MIVVDIMKKSYYYLFAAIAGVISLILLINAKTNLNSIDVNVKFVDDFINEQEYQKLKVCVLNKYQDYDLVEVNVDNFIDPYLYVFELYNIKRNSLPIGFEVISNYILEVIEYKKINDNITFIVKKSNIPEEEIMKLLKMMMITYQFMDIKKVNLKIGENNYFLEYN